MSVSEIVGRLNARRSILPMIVAGGARLHGLPQTDTFKLVAGPLLALSHATRSNGSGITLDGVVNGLGSVPSWLSQHPPRLVYIDDNRDYCAVKREGNYISLVPFMSAGITPDIALSVGCNFAFGPNPGFSDFVVFLKLSHSIRWLSDGSIHEGATFQLTEVEKRPVFIHFTKVNQGWVRVQDSSVADPLREEGLAQYINTFVSGFLPYIPHDAAVAMYCGACILSENPVSSASRAASIGKVGCPVVCETLEDVAVSSRDGMRPRTDRRAEPVLRRPKNAAVAPVPTGPVIYGVPVRGVLAAVPQQSSLVRGYQADSLIPPSRGIALRGGAGRGSLDRRALPVDISGFFELKKQ